MSKGYRQRVKFIRDRPFSLEVDNKSLSGLLTSLSRGRHRDARGLSRDIPFACQRIILLSSVVDGILLACCIFQTKGISEGIFFQALDQIAYRTQMHGRGGCARQEGGDVLSEREMGGGGGMGISRCRKSGAKIYVWEMKRRGSIASAVKVHGERGVRIERGYWQVPVQLNILGCPKMRV